MCPADIEEVKRLCRRIVEEQDPTSFFSLVEALNRLRKMTANKLKRIHKGTPPDTKNTVWQLQSEFVQSVTTFVYELRTARPPTLRQSRDGS